MNVSWKLPWVRRHLPGRASGGPLLGWRESLRFQPASGAAAESSFSAADRTEGKSEYSRFHFKVQPNEAHLKAFFKLLIFGRSADFTQKESCRAQRSIFFF